MLLLIVIEIRLVKRLHFISLFTESAQGFSIELNLDKMPVVGENICFSVTVTNHDSIQKRVREYANAQAKRYDTIPSDTFWEADNFIELSPYGSMCSCKRVEFMFI